MFYSINSILSFTKTEKKKLSAKSFNNAGHSGLAKNVLKNPPHIHYLPFEACGETYTLLI